MAVIAHHDWQKKSRRAMRVTMALLALIDLSGGVRAMELLADEDIAHISGAGLTFSWIDTRMLLAPQSYFEQVGSPGGNTCTATGNSAGNQLCHRRGDMRWYGLGVSGVGTAVGQGLTSGEWNTTWTETAGNMTQCADAGFNGLGCPRGGRIGLFAAHDNPYLLRVMAYDGADSATTSIGNGVVTYQGNTGSGNWNGSSNGVGAGSRQTVLEWLAPTSQDAYRFSFWGEIEVGRGGTGTGLLKSQTIVQGNAAGSVMRFYKFTQKATSPGLAQPFNPYLGTAGCTDAGCANVDAAGSTFNNGTMAIVYESRLQGDFRFSVAQTEAAPVLGIPVEFDAREGLHFRNVKAFFPLGQSFYQGMVLDVPRNSSNAPVKDGNFTLEMPPIPNRTAVFTRFYSHNTGNLGAAAPQVTDVGYATAKAALLDSLPVTGGSTPAYMPARTAASITDYPAPNANYRKTHGYSHWGDWEVCRGVGCRLPLTANSVANASAGIGRNSWNSTGDGIFFYGLSAFNAYAYRTESIDVRSGQNTYTAIDYYGNFASCTPANATAYAACGYGGAYQGSAALGKSVSTASFIPPENGFLNRQATGMGAAENRNVIAVPANAAVNLGDARVDGMLINYMRFLSYGAAN